MQHTHTQRMLVSVASAVSSTVPTGVVVVPHVCPGAAEEGSDRVHGLQLLHGRGSPCSGAKDPRVCHHAVRLFLTSPQGLPRLRRHGHLLRQHRSGLPEACAPPRQRERIPLLGRVSTMCLTPYFKPPTAFQSVTEPSCIVGDVGRREESKPLAPSLLIQF